MFFNSDIVEKYFYAYFSTMSKNIFLYIFITYLRNPKETSGNTTKIIIIFINFVLLKILLTYAYKPLVK